jgi:23S rRNA pseudouridine1911/1915/1917 synthase
MDVGASVIDGVISSDLAGSRLDRGLALSVPSMSRERLKALISSGAVFVNGTTCDDPSSKIKGGEAFAINLPAVRPLGNEAQAIGLTVAYEDDDLIVIDKPAGMVVHPAAGNFEGTLVNALLHHCAGRLSGIGGVARPGIVHRIDKDTSGLIVAAKTDRAHEGLSSQFAAHSIDRRYAAIVGGVPGAAEGTVEAPLARSPYDRKKMAIVEASRGKRAVTRWRLLKPLRFAASVECRLETGRTHQVRVHMASIGHALVGDPVYGRGRPEHRALLSRLGFSRQALHAAGLGFRHPVSKENLSFVSPIPSDMQELFTALAL